MKKGFVSLMFLTLCWLNLSSFTSSNGPITNHQMWSSVADDNIMAYREIAVSETSASYVSGVLDHDVAAKVTEHVGLYEIGNDTIVDQTIRHSLKVIYRFDVYIANKVDYKGGFLYLGYYTKPGFIKKIATKITAYGFDNKPSFNSTPDYSGKFREIKNAVIYVNPVKSNDPLGGDERGNSILSGSYNESQQEIDEQGRGGNWSNLNADVRIDHDEEQSNPRYNGWGSQEINYFDRNAGPGKNIEHKDIDNANYNFSIYGAMEWDSEKLPYSVNVDLSIFAGFGVEGYNTLFEGEVKANSMHFEL